MQQQQRGQMIPRGPNSWLLRIYRGGETDHQRGKYSSKSFHGTTSQARQALTQMLREVDTHSFVARTRLTLHEYLTSWLEDKIDLSSKTRENYRDMLKHFSTIGHFRLSDIDSRHIQRCVTTMLTEALSPRTVDYSVRILGGALEDAVQQGLIVRNVTKLVNRPKQVKRGATVLTVAQINLFLEVTASSRYGVLWRGLLTTGMRPGEAFGLKWSDIDLEEGWLSVRRTLVSDGRGKSSLVEGAKADSERRIGLPESTTLALRDHKRQQARAMLSLGSAYDRGDLVFANNRGGPVEISKVRRAWKAALKSASLPVIRLYDARHTHLTALLANGADIAWVAARAGHSNIQMTRDHYAHVLPETHRAMGEITERLLKQR